MRWRHPSAVQSVLVPTLLAVGLGFYGSLIWTGYVSFTRSGLLPDYRLAGFVQYARLFATERWYTACTNALVFGVGFVGIALALGILLAVLIDQRVRFEAVFRTVFLYPLSMSFIVTGLAWQWFLNPTMGLQSFVRGLGWDGFRFDWIVRGDTAIYTLVIAAVWHSTGLIMAIMLAGLRGIDHEVWRAARVDGISRARTYVSIVLPMLRPLVVTCAVLLVIDVVKSYDLVIAMTKGGPSNATDMPAKFVVDMSFERGNVGLASAGAMMMMLTVVVALAPYFYVEAGRRNR